MQSTIECRPRRKLVLFAALLILALPFGAAAKTDFSSLSVRHTDDFLFACEECEFALSVPGVEPDALQAELSPLPPGVRFVSAKKEFDGNGGTLIRFRLVFPSAGTFSLPPVSLRHRLRTYSVPFASVAVSENPSLVYPSLFASVDDGAEFFVGESVFFTVYAKHAARILDFRYTLPKDSIFFERERFFSGTDGESLRFSPEAVPLARFEWKPLRSGEQAFPEMSIDALSYGGERKTVSLSREAVFVGASRAHKAEEAGALDGFYAAEDAAPGGADARRFFRAPGGFEAECEELRTLRSAERRAFPLSASFGESRARREELERQMGIPPFGNEKNVWIAHLLFVVAGVFLSLFVLFLGARRTRPSALFFSLFVVSLPFAVMYESDFAAPSGIFFGGGVSVIPEDLGDGAGQFVPAGFRVKIMEKSADWVYIEAVDCSGWAHSGRVRELM